MDKMTNIIREEKLTSGSRVYFSCDQCGEESSRQACEFYRAKNNHFCSQPCSELYKKNNLTYSRYEEIPMLYWNQKISDAKKRQLEFSVTIEEAWNQLCKQSHLCAMSGVEIGFTNSRDITASLDRIDSSKGYIPGNIQWVHKTVNAIKWDLGVVDFQEWCYRIANKSERFPLQLDFSDVLIKPQRTTITTRNDVSLIDNLLSDLIPNVVPVIAANFDTVGSMSMADALSQHGMMTCLNKHYSAEKLIAFFDQPQPHVFYSIGATQDDFRKLQSVLSASSVSNICLDVANAYIPQVLEAIQMVHELAPTSTLMVGNVATPEPLSDFQRLGVDIVKVGIGSGGVCETRTVAGVGVPQFSCVLDCVEEANRLGIKICSDGGCRTPADIVKAFAAGASMVMVGSMLSGTDECEGEWVERNGVRYLRFYGMSSHEAMKKYGRHHQNYRASEGRLVEVPYRGSVNEIAQQILGGLRSACTYTNSPTLAHLPQNAKIIRVNQTHNHI